MLQFACQSAGMAVPLDHLLSRRNSLSPEFVCKIFGEEIANELNSKQTKVTTKQSKPSQKNEYGPQLPNTSTNTNTSTSTQTTTTSSSTTKDKTVFSWGKEPYGSPEFSWFKFLSRTTLELLLVSVLAIIVANGMNAKNNSK